MTAAKRKRTMNRSILGGKLLVPAFLLALGQTQTVLARTEHALPLIMSASNRIQQGFVRQAPTSPIFNPASNRSQQSRPRLVNPSDNSVNVTIGGRDDEGKAPAGDVRFDIPPGAARTITAHPNVTPFAG